MFKSVGFTLIVVLLVSGISPAQVPEAKTALDSFNIGLYYYNQGNKDTALQLWKTMLENGNGKHTDIYGSTYFNIPTIYWQLGQKDSARIWYMRLLNSDLKDNDETGMLMEPHTNYKHKSAVALAGLSQSDTNWMDVLHWLNQADTVYRYWGFEGSATSVSKRQSYLNTWKVAVYRKLHQDDQAIHELLIELICASHLETFFSQSGDTLLSMVNHASFKTELDHALNHATLEQVDSTHWVVRFKMNSLAYRIPYSSAYPSRDLPHYWRILFIKPGESPTIEKFIQDVHSRSFYLQLNQ